MARNHPESLDLNQFPPPSEGFSNYDHKAESKRIEAELEKLWKLSDQATPSNPLHFIMTFPAADGYALYRITKVKPLTLQHIYAHDGWQVADAWIRGIAMDDVLLQIKRARNLPRRKMTWP